MPRRPSKEQKRIVSGVMRAYKQGELRQGGSNRKVRSRKQAVAIALSESGASDRQSPRQNARRLKETRQKLRRKTGDAETRTKAELMQQARRRNIQGRARMSKDELARALQRS